MLPLPACADADSSAKQIASRTSVLWRLAILSILLVVSFLTLFRFGLLQSIRGGFTIIVPLLAVYTVAIKTSAIPILLILLLATATYLSPKKCLAFRPTKMWWLWPSTLYLLTSVFLLLSTPYPPVMMLVLSLTGTMILLLFHEGLVYTISRFQWWQGIVDARTFGLLGLLLVGAVAVGVYRFTPFVVDSWVYWAHAGILMRGSFALPPPVPGEIFRENLFILTDHAWFSQYPPGHAVFLAIGRRLGAGWLVNPIAGTIAIYLLFRLAAHLHGRFVGAVAATLLMISPFFLTIQGGFMNHGTALPVLLAAVYTVVLLPAKKRPALWAFAGGFLVAWAFTIRPLTAIAFAIPLFIYALAVVWRSLANPWRVLAGSVLGVIPPLIFQLWFNVATTGDPFVFGYKLSTFLSHSLGFVDGHTPLRGILQCGNNVYQMSWWLLGFPLSSYLFIGIFALFGKWSAEDLLHAGLFVSLTFAYLFYGYQDHWHGPRFLYESIPYLMLLSARGITIIAVSIRQVLPQQAWLAAALGLAVSVIGFSLIQTQERLSKVVLSHWSHQVLVRELLDEWETRNDSIVFLNYQHPAFGLRPQMFMDSNMQNYPNGPLWIRDFGDEKNSKIMEGFPGRKFYRMDSIEQRPVVYTPIIEK